MKRRTRFLLPGMFAFLCLLPMACNKNQNQTDSIAKCLVPGQTTNADLITKWQLIATRIRFSVANPDTNWVAVDGSAQKVIIQFTPDSIFSYSDNYVWKDQLYDRFKTIAQNEFNPDSANVRIYATVLPTGNIGIYQSVRAKLMNNVGLLVSYMSVDVSKQELYIRQDVANQ